MCLVCSATQTLKTHLRFGQQQALTGLQGLDLYRIEYLLRSWARAEMSLVMPGWRSCHLRQGPLADSPSVWFSEGQRESCRQMEAELGRHSPRGGPPPAHPVTLQTGHPLEGGAGLKASSWSPPSFLCVCAPQHSSQTAFPSASEQQDGCFPFCWKLAGLD